jgi:serine/threonine protein kinase
MGEVWCGTHVITGKKVALKLLRSAFSCLPDMRRRLLREVQAASAARHPNVVEVLEAFEGADGTPVMVMPLLEGETLAALLEREGPLSPARTLSLLLPVLSALDCAHRAGVVHCDLKPENIFVEQLGGTTDVKVLDFGIAAYAGDDSSDPGVVSATGAFLGTPAYMAPEQGLGEAELDKRVDVWALGVILYECMSGLRPIEGANVAQVIRNLLTQCITPLEVVAPTVPAELCKLVMRMLSRERALRPSNLGEILPQLCDMFDAEQRAPKERHHVARIEKVPSVAVRDTSFACRSTSGVRTLASATARVALPRRRDLSMSRRRVS